jgi:hypothetical protein
VYGREAKKGGIRVGMGIRAGKWERGKGDQGKGKEKRRRGKGKKEGVEISQKRMNIGQEHALNATHTWT